MFIYIQSPNFWDKIYKCLCLFVDLSTVLLYFWENMDLMELI
jgi:hypothetical protein